jgi:hypothetical protein
MSYCLFDFFDSGREVKFFIGPSFNNESQFLNDNSAWVVWNNNDRLVPASGLSEQRLLISENKK